MKPEISTSEYSPSEYLVVKETPNSIILMNQSKKELTLDIKLIGSKTFSLPEKYKSIKVKAEGYLRIPFEFRERNVGWPIALQAKYNANIRLFSIGPKNEKELLKTIKLMKTGPALVPRLNCMQTLTPKAQKRGNSPPVITITSRRPGTDFPVNTGTVELAWNISGADSMDDFISYPGAEVLEPGTFTDAYGWESSDHETLSSGSYTYTPGASLFHSFEARNDDGEVHEGEALYHCTRTGYRNAKCPAGASIDTNELNQIRIYLDNIDALLRTNVLEDLSGFIEEWNRRLDERVDIDPADRERYRLTIFEDIDYLSGGVGTGGLADDILASMENVLIYIKPYTLPRGFRPGTTSPDTHYICQELEGHEVYGVTPAYETPAPEYGWISICREIGADDFTLLHELYHYATGDGNELKATAITSCCFDQIPW
jgi:hypothetical protein